MSSRSTSRIGIAVERGGLMISPTGALTPLGKVPHFFWSTFMQVTQPPGRYLLTMEELQKRHHHHAYITSNELASQYKTGVLDVQLLLDAGLYVPDVLDACAVVGVKFAASTFNFSTRRREAVFTAYDANGNLLGHHPSCAFKALML